MPAPVAPPFSARVRGPHRQIDADFPTTARTGLLHLLADLVERDYLPDWIAIARELHRIGRLPVFSYDSLHVPHQVQAREDTESAIHKLNWAKIFDFCERLYSHIVQERGHEDQYGNYCVDVARSQAQDYVSTELQRLFLEEGLAYEFAEGSVRRRGRKNTVELLGKAQLVLGAAELGSARKHYDKALQFFRNPTLPDYENSVKEAVCSVEAAGKSLFPMAKAATLGDLAKWLSTTKEVSVPKALCQTITAVYAFRSGGDGVGHGGATGGKATVEVAEYVLAICASQIVFLVDLANQLEPDVPF